MSTPGRGPARLSSAPSAGPTAPSPSYQFEELGQRAPYWRMHSPMRPPRIEAGDGGGLREDGTTENARQRSAQQRRSLAGLLSTLTASRASRTALATALRRRTNSPRGTAKSTSIGSALVMVAHFSGIRP